MAKDRRADAVLFGFDFQVNAAIVLMLENITELRSLRLESENEDIDIELYSGDHILAQAKAIVNSSTDFRNVRKNLKKALENLYPKAQIVIDAARGLCSFYAEKGGLMIGFETA